MHVASSVPQLGYCSGPIYLSLPNDLPEFTELRPKYECCTLWGRYYNVKLFAEMSFNASKCYIYIGYIY